MTSCLKLLYSSVWGTMWHCGTNRNVAGLLEFFIDMILYSTEVYSASNSNEYQEYFLVG